MAKIKTKKEIRESLLEELKSAGRMKKHMEDMVEDYTALWDIKNELIIDIRSRGAIMEVENGKDTFIVENKSVDKLNKVNTQMLKILGELNLKVLDGESDDDEEL